ncbi:hypothetical protein SAMN04488498_109210 [Mesorhizobium albiziae]|uniref:Uncharacterized protein n=1 Tax=Neomesorhizobium albiziae TaxID=335020 RepID=A0A1I4B5A6_9HYPH|nr:hypothetical protein [Mesorhizobium albiziae]GLS34342.1 hypothetical protein GCM10007937_60570 [Mesorhizobium albiziae]SFK63934.1 hypothetical protein SAMN04488498_109210 [Mesorhizobium albiziae]
MEIDDVVELSRLTAIVLGMCIGTVALIAVVGLVRAPESTIELMLLAAQSGLVIRMTTAIVIVIAIFGLRIIDKISPDAAIATISGIAGYILGSQQAPKPASATSDASKSSDASQSS